jgi:hypothetical protein
VLQHDVFIDAGPCISVVGQAREGDVVGHISVRHLDAADGDAEQSREYDVRFGTITVIPLGSGRHAALNVSADKRVNFGLPSAPNDPARSDSTIELTGGALGIIVDARGRPLVLPADPTVRQARIMDWLQAVDAVSSDVFSSLG